MEIPNRFQRKMNHSSSSKLKIVRGLLISVAIVLLYFHAKASEVVVADDKNVSAAIKTQINGHKLHYPKSVARFYQMAGYKLAWIAPDTVKMHAQDAMLMLDCVLQYGFTHKDYYPDKLTYDELRQNTELHNKASVSDKASFDVLLTDAMLTFINHLHYGKLNPEFTALKLDQGSQKNGNAAKWLVEAMSSPNFMAAVLSVQPQQKVYRDLQDMMRLMTAQYIGDCYELPAAEIRKVAVNLERLRWLNTEKTNLTLAVSLPSDKAQHPLRMKKIYLTCAMKDGILVQYPDPDHLDQALEKALYQ